MNREASSSADLICLIGQLGNGGTERQLYLFLKHLDRERIRPLVAVSDVPRGIWRERLEGELGVPVVFLGGVPGPLKLLRFRRLVKERRPQAILSWSFFTNAFRLVAGRTWFVGSLRQQFSVERVLYRRRVRACLSCPKLIVNSSFIAEELRSEQVPAERIEVVFNIFEPETAPRHRDALRREWRIPDDAVVVAGAGRDAPEKDFPFFLATFAEAKRACPRLHGLLLGAGGKALAPAIRERGLADAFTVTGEIPDGRRLFAAADIFFLSSRAEGLPNVLLEAIDAGCAVLATDVGGVRDILGEESRDAGHGLALRLVLHSPQGEAGSRDIGHGDLSSEASCGGPTSSSAVDGGHAQGVINAEPRPPSIDPGDSSPAGIIVKPGDITGAVAGLVRLAGDAGLRRAMSARARSRLAAFSPAAAMTRYLEILRITP